VEQSWNSKSKLSVLIIATIALVWSPGAGSGRWVRTQPRNSANTAILPQQLGTEGQSALRAIEQAGTLSDLRWPDFSDYQDHVRKFYESYSYALPWVKGMEPTPEAQQVIAVLLQADQKGSSAEVYDGPRWIDRLAKLKPVTDHPSESDASRFDLALPLSCKMNYPQKSLHPEKHGMSPMGSTRLQVLISRVVALFWMRVSA
jgi:hypothetical protein